MDSSIPIVLQEIKSGAGIGLAKAARTWPGISGKSVNSTTVFRWCVNGVRAADGSRVKLEHCRIGNRIFTSEMAVERFVIRLTDGMESSPTPRSPSARQRASDRAEKELKAIGC